MREDERNHDRSFSNELDPEEFQKIMSRIEDYLDFRQIIPDDVDVLGAREVSGPSLPSLIEFESIMHPLRMSAAPLRPSLIVIDHLAAFHHQDEDREKQMKKVKSAIETLMSLKGSSILVLNHFNKQDSGTFFRKLRGSSALYAICDAACEVRTLSKTEDGRLEKVGLIPQARKDITLSPLRIKIEEELKKLETKLEKLKVRAEIEESDFNEEINELDQTITQLTKDKEKYGSLCNLVRISSSKYNKSSFYRRF